MFLTDKSEIAQALCISAFLHFALLAFLIFVPGNNVFTTPAIAGMNLVWVSLGSASGQNTNSGPPGAFSSVNNRQTSGEKSNSAHRFAQAIYATSESIRPAQASAGKSQTDAVLESPAQAGHEGGGKSSALTAYPVYGKNMPPVYPEIARLRGYEGIVLIAAEVLPSGRVGETRIKKSSGYSILDQSALEAVKPWKFEPAKKAGQPFTMWVEVPIKFVLQKNKISS